MHRTYFRLCGATKYPARLEGSAASALGLASAAAGVADARLLEVGYYPSHRENLTLFCFFLAPLFGPNEEFKFFWVVGEQRMEAIFRWGVGFRARGSWGICLEVSQGSSTGLH